tara:strand:+ start:983 stop:1189 length:207 start_codon:yes stop_codon:yes gene_type:complete
MVTINRKSTKYVKCDICGDLVGSSSPAIEASYGFCDDDGGFWVEESIIVHHECKYGDIIGRLTNKVEE